MLTVLVVEDEVLVRRGIVEAVDWAALGCTVVGEAADGAEGFSRALAQNPDIIIADIRMPRMDGIEMLRRLRAEGCGADVILLTAYGEFAYAQEALRLHAADYLLKPFHDGDLEAAIRRIELRRSPDTRPELLPELQTAALGRYSDAAVRYIASHYNDPDICVGKIAEALAVSEGHLSHSFKKETGMTLMGYVTAYRMHIAKQLLADCRSRVSEVADKVGYQDLSNFSAAFKKTTGLSPSEYQKQCRA